MVMKRFKIEDRMIGEGCPTFIVAEIGYNFNTLDEAIKSIDAAKECCVDAVKFQTFKAETVVTKGVMFPPEAGGGSQFDEFKKYELSEDWHRKLFAHAKKRGLIVFSTPSHPSDLPLLESLKVPVYKVGSDDLTNLPFLVEIAKLGKPMIVSTGMSTFSEVEEAVKTILAAGNDKLVLLHCISNYPVKKLEHVNLRAMQTMAESFGVLVGYSDHTTTLSTPVAAVALGACVYERHFTIDKNLPAPDAALSADPAEMKQIVQLIRETEAMLGDGVKKPAPPEMDMRRDSRKSLVSKRAIKKGEPLTLENVTIKRPGHGIPPKFLSTVIGRIAKVNIPDDTVITWEMV
jgi:sialic acid synthase SpsE